MINWENSPSTKTPINAENLNKMQTDLIEDIDKNYTGTNITGNTVNGCGRIKAVLGNISELGTGDKSPENPYRFDCVGDDINLLKQEDITNSTVAGITYKSLSDYVEVSGTSTAQSVLMFNDIVSRLQIGVSYKTLIKQNSAFSFLFKISYNDGTATAYSSEFTHASNISSVIPYLQLASGQTVNDKLYVKVSKKKGSSWSPYNKGTVEIISANSSSTSSNIAYIDSPLCKLGNVRDKIDYTERKIHRNLSYRILDGSEAWAIGTTDTSGINRFMLKDTRIKKYDNSVVGNILCNKLNTINAINSYARVEGISGISTGGLYIFIDACKSMTIDQFKEYLASNNLIVICELETAVTESIDCSDKIVQYDTSTNVYCRDTTDIEVSLTNNNAIADINKNLHRIEQLLAGGV